MLDLVELYTDGACRGNPGVGGWGVVMRWRDRQKTLIGAEAQTTNNRMELTAAIMALESLRKPCAVVLITDSEYVKKGLTEWLPAWKKRGWKTAAKKPVKNADLWQRLDAAAGRHKVEWRWVRGHSGQEGNELADALANQAIDKFQAGQLRGLS